MAKNYYEILGISKGASVDEVKKAYRALSKELHPDKHSSASSEHAKKEAEQRFKEVNQAYEVLSNPEKKKMYDQFGEAAAAGGASGFGQGSNPFGAGFDFSGFQSGNFSGFGDMFESFFGGGRRAAPQQERGSDREVEVTIDLSDVVMGKAMNLSVRRLQTCDTCKGNGAEPGSKLVTCSMCNGTGQVVRTAQSIFGMVQQASVCPQCKGSGKTPEKPCKKCDGEGRRVEDATVTVNVPAGIDDGQTLRVRGEGDAGRQSAAAGDLYVNVRVRQDPRFRREGADIHAILEISVPDAILGMEAEVPTVQGSVKFKVPEGTQPGQVLRIKGKGLPVLSSSRHGDHYVEVIVKIPTKLSREEKRLIEEWKKVKN